jgi:adenylate kinase family enzyme
MMAKKGYNDTSMKREGRWQMSVHEVKTIHIFGSSGSGSTTLARALAERFGFHHVDTDEALWIPTDPPFTQKRSPEAAKKLIEIEMARHEKNVVSGEFFGWGDFLRDRIDLYIYMNLPVEIRLERIRAREQKRFGSRVLPGGDMHTAHMEFLEWVRSYESDSGSHRSKKAHLHRLETLDKPVIRIEESRSIPELLESIAPFLF